MKEFLKIILGTEILNIKKCINIFHHIHISEEKCPVITHRYWEGIYKLSSHL